MSRRAMMLVGIAVAVLMIPTVAFAAAGSFSSGSGSTAAVTATNTASTGKGVYGRATSTSSSTHYGVVGNASGTGGIGVFGTGSKYGLYSNGNLGIKSGKSLVCAGCIGESDLAAGVLPVFATASVTPFDTIGSACTNFGSISIAAPAAGTILLQASVQTRLNHTNGTDDLLVAAFGDSISDCHTGGYEEDVVSVVPAASPTDDIYFSTQPMTRTVTVPSAGTYTYYMNAQMQTGQDASDLFGRAKMTALFLG